MAKKASKSITGSVITITFEEGETVVVDLANIPEAIQTRLALHGLSQKLGDSYAGCEVSEASGKAAGVAKDLLEGNWSMRVAATGPKTTQLAEALSAATGKTLEEAAGVLEGLDDDGKKDLRKHPQIKVQLTLLKAQAAQAAAEKAAIAAEGTEALTL